MRSVGRSTLYNTTNQQYGSKWNASMNKTGNIRTDHVPTMDEIMKSQNDFKKAEKLIKNKIIKEKLQEEGIDLEADNQKYMKTTEFHIKKGQQ